MNRMSADKEIDRIKYMVCCPMCDNEKCIKGQDECEAEIWAKQKRIEVGNDNKSE